MKKVDFEYDIEKHERFFLEQMTERGKRLYLGLQAMKLGYNGVAEVSQKFDAHKQTVPPAKKVRQQGDGRKKTLLRKQSA
jgi:hypothetical protein